MFSTPCTIDWIHTVHMQSKILHFYMYNSQIGTCVPLTMDTALGPCPAPGRGSRWWSPAEWCPRSFEGNSPPHSPSLQWVAELTQLRKQERKEVGAKSACENTRSSVVHFHPPSVQDYHWKWLENCVVNTQKSWIKCLATVLFTKCSA